MSPKRTPKKAKKKDLGSAFKAAITEAYAARMKARQTPQKKA